MVQQSVFPRWKGFHLLNMFKDPSKYVGMFSGLSYDEKLSPGRFREKDFQMMADLGFNFVRLPMDYRLWTVNNNPFEINHKTLDAVDEAVSFGEKYGIHVNLAFHRGPGYCILDSFNKSSADAFDLWTDKEAQDCFTLHWTTFAERYKGVSSKNLSFNMLNEPRNVSAEVYTNLMKSVISEIQAIDADRMCILDGLNTANSPVPELGHMASCGVGMACRGYIPNEITHYGASFFASRRKYPQWPNATHDFENYDDPRIWDVNMLDEHFRYWAAFSDAYHMGVHCSEMGCINTAPHDIALAWLEDFLKILKKYNIGFAMWNLHGTFGMMDSNRKDVDYEDYCGHKLDRKMCDLLQKY